MCICNKPIKDDYMKENIIMKFVYLNCGIKI